MLAVSLRPWIDPAGMAVPSPDPAPVANSVTDVGMSNSTQCQNPLPVGASGSKQVTAKLAVSDGKPLQLSWGETLSPPTPKLASATKRNAMGCPSTRSVLVTVNSSTAAR